MFLYLLSISLPFHLVYIAVFGVAFLYSGSLWFLFIVEVPCCGWDWTCGLSRFPGYGSLCRCSGGWSWISSLWSAMKCPIMSYDISGFGVTLGSLYIEVQGYVPVLLENLHGIFFSGTYWPLGGAWFQCRYGGI